ncbi:MAG: DUF423 domain-containing protein [Opitutae bacterium]|nr:DUF423 domain-containing protein [Opitutae bacterium]
MPTMLSLAGFSGLLAVALGAMGTHALKPLLTAHGLLEAWHTAVLYHLVHAVALLAVSLALDAGATQLHPRRAAGLRAAGVCWLTGIILFSGSLYFMAAFDWRRLGIVTPFGGVALLAGWACLIHAGWRRSTPP